MTTAFLCYFSQLALAGSTAATVLGALALFTMSSVPMAAPGLDPTRSWLTNLVVSHPLVYVGVFCLVSLIALFASIGFVRRQRWAYRTWLGLCCLGVAWFLLCIVSEVHFFLFGLDSYGPMPLRFYAVAWTLVVVTSGLVAVTLIALLLRQLRKDSTKRFFEVANHRSDDEETEDSSR